LLRAHGIASRRPRDECRLLDLLAAEQAHAIAALPWPGRAPSPSPTSHRHGSPEFIDTCVTNVDPGP
jgi:hypothetical protein